LGAAVLVAAIVAAVVFVVAGSEDRGASAGGPRIVSAEGLRTFAASRPLYWAGTVPGTTIELSEAARGRVFVRYLSGGAQPGDRRPAFTTVATYPSPRAYQETARAGRLEGATRRPAPGGGLAVWRRNRPTSVYLAFPGDDVLIEVYDPNAERARGLVLDGEVGPVR